MERSVDPAIAERKANKLANELLSGKRSPDGGKTFLTTEPPQPVEEEPTNEAKADEKDKKEEE